MIKIFGDRRAVWQKQTDFFALRQGKEPTVLDFANTIKHHQGKAEMGPGTVFGGVKRNYCQASGNSRPQNI